MNREEQIKDAALDWNWILKERGDVNYPDDFTLNVFIEGAKWADANPHWISVKDNLPDDGVNVLVFTGKKMAISSIYTFNGVKHWKGSSSFGDSITHWMKLPKQPK